MTWLTLSTIPAPKPTDYPDIVDFMLAYGIYDDVRYPVSFLDGQMGPQYANPQAYRDNMIEYAQGMAHLAPVGWDAVAAAKAACAVGFTQLQQLPVNAADPATWSVFMAWVMGTGTLYGGHPPIPASVPKSVVTSAPASGDTGPITIFGEPVK